jgi:hypothetical protein
MTQKKKSLFPIIHDIAKVLGERKKVKHCHTCVSSFANTVEASRKILADSPILARGSQALIDVSLTGPPSEAICTAA